MELDYKALEITMGEVSGDVQIPLTDLNDLAKKRSATMLLDPERTSKEQRTGEQIDKPPNAKLLIRKEDRNDISIENAIDALQAIQDIDDELLLDACDLLEDERKAKTFLALDVNLRKKWLLRKLGR